VDPRSEHHRAPGRRVPGQRGRQGRQGAWAQLGDQTGGRHRAQPGAAEVSGAQRLHGQRDVGWAIRQARRFLDAGAYLIMIESEGITENTPTWRTDAAATIIDALGLEKVMFEAADPDVFAWYIKNYGPDVNLFVDHSQIVQLETLRAGIWGTKSLWGRVVTYKG